MTLDTDELADPNRIPDRTLLREDGAMSVYIVYGGVRYGFPSQEALFFANFTFDDVQIVQRDGLGHIPRVPPNGTFVQEWKTGLLYLVWHGRKLLTQEDAWLGLGGTLDTVVGVPWGTLDGIPTAGPYRAWKVGRLSRMAIPLCAFNLRPAVQSARSLSTAFLIGVLSGVVATWLLSGDAK